MANSPSLSNELIAKPNPVQPWEDFETILRHAEHARALQDLPRAHSLYARLVEINPNDSRGWAGLADTAASTDEAIIGWAYTLALKPNSWEARIQIESHIDTRIKKSGVADAAVLIALARTLAEVGQKLAAYRLMVHATELDPTNVEAWIWRAGVTSDPADTIKCLRHALTLDPSNAKAQAGLEWALSKQSAAPRTSSNAATAVKLFEQGQSALAYGNTLAAHNYFVLATERDPHNESAWFWRGSTAPNTEESLACMEQTVTINPHHRAAQDARWYLRVKKYRESFAIRTSPPIPFPSTAETTPANPPAPNPPAPQRSNPWAIALGLFVLLVILISLFIILARPA